MAQSKRYRLRIIIPSFPNFNIYTFAASSPTSVGPVYVATVASKLELWDVEIIDENNCHGRYCPRTDDGQIDHRKLQKERPADVVGFYGSISSTIPRLYELALVYKEEGARTVAGGKHIENLPEEALANNIDVVVFREGELTIREVLLAWEKGAPLDTVDGIAFLKNSNVFKTPERPLIHDFDKLPMPDFNLLRYAKMKYYPINRTRGCNLRCEFCAVKEKARCASPKKIMEQIEYLVENKKVRHFFEASDHFAANREEAIEFCKLLAAYQQKHNIRLKITVQTRITDAKYPELLQSMKEANISAICIGYESPIDQELIAMKKGYLAKDMLQWTKNFHEHGFFIHGMFIFGYPKRPDEKFCIPLDQKVMEFRKFIQKAKIDTVQVLMTMPLPGTELRARLENTRRLYPLHRLGWEYYDGQFPLYVPDDNVTPEELQRAVGRIMSNFYNFRNFLKIVKNILFHFPRIVIFSSFTIFIGRVKYITSAFNKWYRKYYRNYLLRFGGYIMLKRWLKDFKKGSYPEKLKMAKDDLYRHDM